LTSSEGKPVRASDYRGVSNLVLVFAHNPDDEFCQLFLTGLAQHYSEFIEEDAEVLLVIQGSRQEAEQVKRGYHLPFPILADQDGRACRAAGAITSDGKPAMTVYITDRYNEIYSVYRTSEGDALPTLKEMLERVRFIEIQCPE
jgi:peroxiredoxin